MSHKPSKSHRATPAQAAAGRANLALGRDPQAARTHGATTAEARRGELPEGFEHLQPVVDHFADGWVGDLGGQGNVSTQREALLFAARACLVVVLLAIEHIRQHGFTQNGKPAPVLGVMGTYVNSLRLNLVAAGLDRVAKDITPDTLQGYLERKATEKAGDPT